jgi:hypothetical protein
VVLVVGYHPHHSVLGIVSTAATARVMFRLAAGKAKTGTAWTPGALRDKHCGARMRSPWEGGDRMRP